MQQLRAGSREYADLIDGVFGVRLDHLSGLQAAWRLTGCAPTFDARVAGGVAHGGLGRRRGFD